MYDQQVMVPFMHIISKHVLPCCQLSHITENFRSPGWGKYMGDDDRKVEQMRLESSCPSHCCHFTKALKKHKYVRQVTNPATQIFVKYSTASHFSSFFVSQTQDNSDTRINLKAVNNRMEKCVVRRVEVMLCCFQD